MWPGGIRAALAAAAVLIGTGATVSQEAGGGIRLLFGISSSLRAHDNLDLDPISAGTTVRSDTRLSFGLQSETSRQKLALTIGTVLRAEDVPGGGFSTGFENPWFDLSYSREGANARLSFTASFDRTDVDRADPLSLEEIDVEDLIIDAGSRDSYSVGAVIEIGSQAPLGFMLDLKRKGTRYAGTSDPGLFDRTTDGASATAKLRFSSVTEGRATLSAERYSAEDAAMTTRDTRRLGFGVTHELSETTVLKASLGASEIDDSVTGVRRGTDLALSLIRTLPRGSVGLSLDHKLTSAGQRSTLQVERSFAFPEGEIVISLGAADGEGAGPQAIGSLAYSRDLPMGRFSASLSRNVSVNSDVEVQRTTRAAVGYSHTVNGLSSVAFNLDYVEVSAASDSERGRFSAVYQHALTEDWNLSAGYERRYLNSAGSGAAWDNSVFVTLSREFSFLR